MHRLFVSLIDVLRNRERLFIVGRTLSVSVLNQAVSSGTNFLLAIYLVRVLTAADFGMYGIGFAITLLYAGAGDAIFLTQMVVHVPDKRPSDRLPYAARILIALLLFCVVTVFIMVIVVLLLNVFIFDITNYIGLSFAITTASVGYLTKDFFIRHAYTAKREQMALLVNISIATSMLIILLFSNYMFVPLNSTSALWIYAGSNIIGAVVGFFFAKLPIFSVNLLEIRNDLREAWVGGRWALGGVGITWSQTQAYMYVTAIFIGPAGVGLANAAKIMITPALFLMPAITQLAVPRLAALRSINQSKMVKISLLYSAGLACFAIAYSFVLIGLGGHLAQLLIGKYKYDVIFPIMIAWCVLLICQFSRVGTVICLQVAKEFKVLTLMNSISLFAAIAIAIILMKIIGIEGAVLGSGIGELIFSILLYKVVKIKFSSFK